MPANSAMPGMSSDRSRPPRSPAERLGASLATPSRVATSVMSASGMFTANSARQPNAPASTPPSGSPKTAVTCDAIEKLPRTRLGTPMPTLSARLRTSAIAVGYAAEVPTPIRARDSSRKPNAGASGADHAAGQQDQDAREEHPARAEDASTSLPIVGCITALHR